MAEKKEGGGGSVQEGNSLRNRKGKKEAA